MLDVFQLFYVYHMQSEYIVHIAERWAASSSESELHLQVLSPAIQEFLSSSIWADWMDKLSEDMDVDKALMDKFLDSFLSATRQGPADSEVNT